MVMIPISSDLQRKRWIMQGMLQAASESFWSKFTSNSEKSPVILAKNPQAGHGHTVVFQAYGNLTGKAIEGKDKATGRGETKRVFSDKISVRRYRFVVENGDKFDAINTNDLSLTQHANSRQQLGDLWVRWKDQMITDTMSSMVDKPTHRVLFDTIAAGEGVNAIAASSAPRYNSDGLVDNHSFDYHALLGLATLMKTSREPASLGNAVVHYPRRRPILPYRMMKGGQKGWMLIVDSFVHNMLLLMPQFQRILRDADVRGSNNRLIDGVVGKIAGFTVVEMDHFFGTLDTDLNSFRFSDSSVELNGLRQFRLAQAPGNDLTADAAQPTDWSGQKSFEDGYDGGKIFTRCLIVGQNAVQFAMGKAPDYHFKTSEDFGITSESCLEAWVHAQKTDYKNETRDYDDAKVTGIDWGVFPVDIRVA